MIRELHVYGYNTQVGTNAKASQHRGIGSKLLKKAEWISYFYGYSGIVVISGEGVKGYYEKKGYTEKDTYMYKDFKMNIRILLYTIIGLLILHNIKLLNVLIDTFK